MVTQKHIVATTHVVLDVVLNISPPRVQILAQIHQNAHSVLGKWCRDLLNN